jgi:YVTN family beta-propeller protein
MRRQRFLCAKKWEGGLHSSIKVLGGVSVLFAVFACALISQEPATTLLSTRAIALNSATGKLYAAEPLHGTVAVYDPHSNATSRIKVGSEPLAIAINEKTNRIYVANHGSGTVSVVDGASGSVSSTIDVGALPYVVAVNAAANRTYVSNVFSDVITVIDGTTNALQKIKAGSADTITLDESRDKAFLAGYQSTKLVVLNRTPQITGDMKVGYHAWGLAVDPPSGILYVTRSQDAALLIIDETSGATTSIPTGSIPCAVALNAAKNRAYVVNHAGDSVTVVDTAKRAVVATIPVGSSPQGIAIDPASNRIYVANSHSSTITVLDAASNSVLKTLPTGKNPYNVLVDPATAHLYVALEGDSAFAVIDLKSN